jgi:transposase
MKHQAGLDVSLEETAICVVDGTGRIVKEARAGSEPQALVAALREIDLPLERVGLEACSLAAWLHDELRVAGLPAICIETHQANAAMKTMPNKTDRNDARALARIMRICCSCAARSSRSDSVLAVARKLAVILAGLRPQARDS